MSKVQTLLKVISYQKENPFATGREISSATGYSERYLRECKKDIKELASYFLGILFERNEIDLLLSKLDPQNQHERMVLDKLQKVHLGDKDGKIEIASSEDKPSMEYLQIALCEPEGSRTHIDFWLRYLLNDTLLHVDKDGEIEYRLAEICEPLGEYSRWRVKLKDDIYWSDGEPIVCDDIESTLIKDSLLFGISEIKKYNEKEITFILKQDNTIFPYWLSKIPLLPSHSPNVACGPFLLRKSKSHTSFHLYRSKDYHISGQPKIDWVKFEVFSRPSSAIKAVLEKKIDLFPIRLLREVNQWTSTPPQSFTANDLTYYALLINQKGHLKSGDNVKQLRESIDYNAINLCISGTLAQGDKAVSRSGISNNLKIGYFFNMPNTEIAGLFSFMAKCIGIQDTNLVDISKYSSQTISGEIDAILMQIYFGYGYSLLRRYFHSKGENKTLGFSYPEIDLLIDQLDATVSMQERSVIGLDIIRKLQQENAIILLAPCFEYVLSNLYIVPSPKLVLLTDFIIKLPNMKVQRGNFSL